MLHLQQDPSSDRTVAMLFYSQPSLSSSSSAFREEYKYGSFPLIFIDSFLLITLVLLILSL